ncbi:MAG: type II toxin-antitoxin system YafQ family toxin [Candidatus Margulisbacteria bacterium]|nr:type II toxin-antitoxin system YafQ family toxin [Candidatus Margulisiibacteriota bacterium]
MLKPFFTGKFKKDFKFMIEKRKRNVSKIKTIITQLQNQELLETKHKDHKLMGDFEGRRECHIEPDWLLVYKIDKQTIIFERTGTHSDLFK